MTKQELLETYTAEQLADKYLRLQERFNQYTEVIQDITNKLPEELKNGTEFHLEIDRLKSEVEKYRKAFEDAKKECDRQIAEYQNRVYKDKTELERAKNTINQIDDILEKLFGVRHDTVDTPDEFEKILSEKAKENVTDFLPTEPIKVADMMINAEGEYEHNPLVKAFYKEDKGTYRIFETGELRQIAEHLLVYCNNNGEVEEC